MFYDQAPTDINAPSTGPSLDQYKEVLENVEKIFPKEKIMMGFELGFQYNHGIWEGLDMDKQVIDYLKQNGYGGIFVWALNQHPDTGENALKVVDYAKNG